MSVWKSFNRFCFYASNLNITKQSLRSNSEIGFILKNISSLRIKANGFHTSCARRDLMEFFDDKKNWSELEVKVGRSWRVEELRIKSNSDLHKLWYVLLKERNMLLTMQHEYQRKMKMFPNPERLDKVEESMENLETVVRERNRAYFELETGENGERPTGIKKNCFGLEFKYKMGEFPVPVQMNKKFLEDTKLYNYTTDHKYIRGFLAKLEEKKRRIKYWNSRVRHKIACEILKTFPNLDEEALKQEFPDIDIEEVKKDPRSRTHGENMY